MGLRLLGLLVVAREIGQDRVLTDERRTVLQQQRRDGVGAGQLEQECSPLAPDRDLMVDIVESELGQALTDPP
jgi:hypothetical protein